MKNLYSFTNLSLIIASSIALCSCASLNMPSTPNMSLLSKKNELNVDVAVSNYNTNLNTAYSISDKYAIIAGGSLSYGMFTKYDHLAGIMATTDPDAWDEIDYHQWNTEVGFGRYLNVSRRNIGFYGGLEYGNSKTTYSDLANHTSVFLQSNFGYIKDGGFLEIAGSVKLLGSYFDVEYINEESILETANFPVCTAQAYGVVRVGSENVKFFVAGGLNFSSINHYNTIPDYTIVSDHLSTLTYLGIGINCKFSKNQNEK